MAKKKATCEPKIQIHPFNGCKISDRVLTLILLQVKSGKEIEVYEQISALLTQKFSIYKGLGRYDLVVIIEGKDFSALDEITQSNHNSILDVTYICGYKWELDESKPKSKKNHKIAGICCLKLKSPKQVEQIRFEQKAIREMSNKITTDDNIEVNFYGGFGWNEILTVVRCDSIQQLTTAIDEIRESLHDMSGAKFLDTSTIPCIDFSFIFDDKLHELKESIGVELLVGSSEPTQKLENYLFDQFKNVSSAFGFHDYVSCINEMPLGEYIEKILDLREKHNVLYTYSVLKHSKISKQNSKTNIQNDEKESLNTGCQEIIQKYQQLTHQSEGKLVKHYMNLVETTKNDLTTDNLFPNLNGIWVRFFEKIKEINEYKPKNIDNYGKSSAIFHDNIDFLRTALIQRHSDVPLANLLGGKNLTTDVIGGSSRLIKAIESIPIYLINNMFNKQWKGICIHGHYNRFYRTYTGIINIPSMYLLNPKRLWSVYHETGHEAYNLLFHNLHDFHETIEDSVISNLAHYKNEIKEEVKKDRHLSAEQKKAKINRLSKKEERRFWHYAQEMFAEMFALRYGFWNDWESWKSMVWTYITGEFGSRVEFLTRTIILRLTLENIETINEIDIPEKIEEIFDELEKFTPITKQDKVTITEEVRTVTRVNISTFLSLCVDIRKEFEKITIRHKINSDNLKEILQKLDAGIPIKITFNDEDITPIAIINSIIMTNQKSQNTLMKRKITALISLYNFYSQNRV